MSLAPLKERSQYSYTGRMHMRHGECKTPGGKLVAVNVAVDEDGTIKSCHISGDFFIEPDVTTSTRFAGAPTSGGEASEALIHDLEQALVRGGSLQSVLDAHSDCRLIGTDASAIETAFLRAISSELTPPPAGDPAKRVGVAGTDTTGTSASVDTQYGQTDKTAEYQSRWNELKRNLTVIRDHPRTPAEQMAIDEIWAREVAAGTRPPTIRFWEWAGAAVVIGKFQSAPDEVHLAVAEQLGFSVVRRCTGGGAMFIEPGNTITYSLYAPLDFVHGISIEESYRLCDWWLVEALRGLGLDVRFAGLNDIASQYGKIGGAAQRRFPGTGNAGESGAVLHHVTMAYDIDAAKMARVLNTSQEKLSDKAVRSAVKRVDPMKSQTGLTREQIIDDLLAWFTPAQFRGDAS